MRQALSRIVGSALDLLFPQSCVACGREGRFLCGACADALPKLERPYCPTCARPGSRSVCQACYSPPPRYNRIAAPFLMSGAVNEMVYGLKYRNLRSYAPHMAELLAAQAGATALAAAVLVPVPLHPRRERSRGYNQSVLLARGLGKYTGMVIEPDLLSRTRDTPPQVSLTGDDASAQHEKRLHQHARRWQAQGAPARRRRHYRRHHVRVRGRAQGHRRIFGGWSRIRPAGRCFEPVLRLTGRGPRPGAKSVCVFSPF